MSAKMSRKTSISGKAKPNKEKVPPTLRQLAMELQPVELSDVLYDDTSIGGGLQYVQLMGMISFLDGFMFLFAGIMIMVFESAQEFHTTGYVMVGVGGFQIVLYFLIQWWHISHSMKKSIRMRW